VTTVAPRTALAQACAALCTEWQADAAKRRSISGTDAGADVLDWCASALREAMAVALDDDAELTVEEYGALHGRPASTVRRWCARGDVRARRAGAHWKIRRGEPAPTFGTRVPDLPRSA